MAHYNDPDKKNWTGRISKQQHYLHEAVQLVSMERPLPGPDTGTIGILGYCCDAGVRRNQGRPGAVSGPAHIRQQLGKLPLHLPEAIQVWDLGDIYCDDSDMEAAQQLLAGKVSALVNKGVFPLVLGGGHDVAYGHYRGLRDTLPKGSRLGIINLDAHLDLRDPSQGNNSGTPFHQIALDAEREGFEFHYLCMGVRSDANDAGLFQRAAELGVSLLPRQAFVPWKRKMVKKQLNAFLEEVDHIYLTIDLDGFSSAYAPGVSAASPMGFCPDIALFVLRHIISSGKLMAADVAELNPAYDKDQQTAKLAASLVHRIMHTVTLG